MVAELEFQSSGLIAVNETLLKALHAESDYDPGGDGVYPVEITELYGPDHGVQTVHTAVGPEGHGRLILDTGDGSLILTLGNHSYVFAPHGASRAALDLHDVVFLQILAAHRLGAFEGGALEVPGWHGCLAVEGENVGRGSHISILRGGGSLGTLIQVLAHLLQPLRLGDLYAVSSPHGNRLEVLGSHHRP